jgi:hypothetical protein
VQFTTTGMRTKSQLSFRESSTKMVSTHVCKTHGQCQRGTEKSSTRMTRPGTTPPVCARPEIFHSTFGLLQGICGNTWKKSTVRCAADTGPTLQSGRSCESQRFDVTLNSLHRLSHKSITRFDLIRMKPVSTTMANSCSGWSSARRTSWQH